MSKFKIGFPLILLLLFTLALLIGGIMPYFLLYILVLTFIIPLSHCLISLNRLHGSVLIPKESLYTGDKIDIEYTIENRSFFLIPYLKVHSDITRQLTGEETSSIFLSLRNKEVYIGRETVVLKRRGYYQLGEIEVTIRDVFRFFSFTKKISSSTELLVYPETINLSTFKITASLQSGELQIHDSAFQDKSRIASVRDYIEGDSIKAIHWKLSARKDSPIVKDYEYRVDTNAIIFIDSEKSLFIKDVDRGLEDKVADVALSIINYCLNHNIQIILEVQNNENYIEVIGHQKSDLKPFLNVLARFSGNGDFDISTLLIPKIETIEKGSTVIIISPNLDKTMGANIIQLKMKNLNPLLIIVTDRRNKSGYIDQHVEKNLLQEGITIYILDTKTSIKESLEVHHG